MDGDEPSFDELYRRYHGYVMYRVRSQFKIDYHTAEDITHEVMIRFWQQLDTIDLSSPQHTYGWLKTVSRRTASKTIFGHNYAADQRRLATELTDMFGDNCVPSYDNIAELLGSRRYSEVWAVVDTLPSNWRDALTLMYWNDLPYTVIAEKMNASVDRVRHYVADGRKALSKVLIGIPL